MGGHFHLLARLNPDCNFSGKDIAIGMWCIMVMSASYCQSARLLEEIKKV